MNTANLPDIEPIRKTVAALQSVFETPKTEKQKRFDREVAESGLTRAPSNIVLTEAKQAKERLDVAKIKKQKGAPRIGKSGKSIERTPEGKTSVAVEQVTDPIAQPRKGDKVVKKSQKGLGREQLNIHGSGTITLTRNKKLNDITLAGRDSILSFK